MLEKPASLAAKSLLLWKILPHSRLEHRFGTLAH